VATCDCDAWRRAEELIRKAVVLFVSRLVHRRSAARPATGADTAITQCHIDVRTRHSVETDISLMNANIHRTSARFDEAITHTHTHTHIYIYMVANNRLGSCDLAAADKGRLNATRL